MNHNYIKNSYLQKILMFSCIKYCIYYIYYKNIRTIFFIIFYEKIIII